MILILILAKKNHNFEQTYQRGFNLCLHHNRKELSETSTSKTPLGGGRPQGRRYQPYLPLYRMHPHYIASREVGIHYLGQRYIALHPHVVRLGYLHVSSSKTGIETELSVSRNPQKHHYFFHNVVKGLSPGVALHEKRRPAGAKLLNS